MGPPEEVEAPNGVRAVEHRLTGESRVRAEGEASHTLDETSSPVEVQVGAGALWVFVPPGGAEVQVDHGGFHALVSQGSLMVDAGTGSDGLLLVTDGEALLVDAAGTSQVLEAGQAAVLGADGDLVGIDAVSDDELAGDPWAVANRGLDALVEVPEPQADAEEPADEAEPEADAEDIEPEPITDEVDEPELAEEEPELEPEVDAEPVAEAPVEEIEPEPITDEVAEPELETEAADQAPVEEPEGVEPVAEEPDAEDEVEVEAAPVDEDVEPEAEDADDEPGAEVFVPEVVSSPAGEAPPRSPRPTVEQLYTEDRTHEVSGRKVARVLEVAALIVFIGVIVLLIFLFNRDDGGDGTAAIADPVTSIRPTSTSSTTTSSTTTTAPAPTTVKVDIASCSQSGEGLVATGTVQGAPPDAGGYRITVEVRLRDRTFGKKTVTVERGDREDGRRQWTAEVPLNGDAVGAGAQCTIPEGGVTLV